MIERRFESRFLCADLVRVDWLVPGTHADFVPGDDVPGDENSGTVEAVLEDISAMGACVQVEQRIPSGAEISISVGTGDLSPDGLGVAKFSGHVSYCVYRDYGYFVGIRFSGETRWSTGVFEPRHLTSLEALALSSTLH